MPTALRLVILIRNIPETTGLRSGTNELELKLNSMYCIVTTAILIGLHIFKVANFVKI